MFCNSCQSARPENEAPCPNCGAPSSLLGQLEEGEPVAAEPESEAKTWNTLASSTGQHASMQLVPVLQQQQLILPEGLHETVFIPPMYTKPRPVIARSRIISGILSVIILPLLLCAGSIYYANATGKVTAIQRLLGIIPPPNIQTAQNTQIPNPPDKVDLGPAQKIIPAAVTTMNVDPKSLVPRERDTVFQVGVPFYVTFSVIPPKAGSVVILWNMNGHFYKKSVKSIDPKVHPFANLDIQMTYFVAASGTAEIDWVDSAGKSQLAQRLYFAVR